MKTKSDQKPNDEQGKETAKRLAERQRACREAMGKKWIGHPSHHVQRLTKGERG
jgi:hypothetical protein